MLERVGKTPQEFKANTHLGKVFRTSGVKATPELRRILALPRRTWNPDEPAFQQFVDDINDWLCVPGGSMRLRPIQAKALADLHDFGGLFGSQAVGSGKCVAPYTEVFDASQSRRRRVDETGQQFKILTQTDLGHVQYSDAISIHSGYKPCYRLTLDDGSSVDLSHDHPVLTHREWVEVQYLNPDDLIAVPRSIPEPLNPTAITNDEVVLAAYLLSDGGVSQASTSFTNQTPVVIEEFLRVSTALADASRNLQGKHPGKEGPQERSSSSNAREFYVRGVMWFRNRWHIHGLAKEKRLPAEFWGLSSKQIGLFLNRFWACDGYINKPYKGKGGSLEVVLASEQMIDDLKFLLLRLGIQGRKRYKKTSLKGQKFDAWRLSISGEDAITFFDQVGMILGKESACEMYRDVLLSTERNTNTDVVPICNDDVIKMADEMGWPKGAVKSIDRGKRTQLRRFLLMSNMDWLSRSKFQKMCKDFGYNGKHAWLANTDLRWERIRSIEEIDIMSVYDVSVPETGSFIGNGIVLHNTLVTLLAAVVLESKKPLLIVPAKLRDKTFRDMAMYQKHFKIRPMTVLSYDILGRINGEKLLLEHAPDLIIGDEVHRLKNTRAAVTRRVSRYMKTEGAEGKVKFVGVSGTVTKRSLRDYAHILKWCLPQSAPIPLNYNDIEEWACALDEKLDMGKRLYFGELSQLCSDEELIKIGLPETTKDEALSVVRQAYRRRLIESPGVVCTTEASVDCSLRIIAVEPKLGEKVDDAFRTLRSIWETPDGNPCVDGFEVWRHAREFAAGFYYRWKIRPKDEWLNARRAWAKFVRETLKHSKQFDSELPVARACARGELDDVEYKAWKEIRDTFEPETEAVWLDDGMLQFAAQWLREHPGVCWVEHQAFGDRLSDLTGLSFFAAGGLDKGKRMIEDAKGPIIASIQSNGEGRNLQQWSEALVISPPPNGMIWEQMLGRLHRQGQEADEVSFDVVISCREVLEGFERAQNDAKYLFDTTGNPQKLLYGDVVVELTNKFGPRW